jgi:hypothetical protein
LTTLEALLADIKARQTALRADKHIYTFCLRDEDPRALLEATFGQLTQGIEKHSTLVDIALSMGRRIQHRLRLEPDSVVATQLGWFVLVSYFELKLLGYRRKKKKGLRHPPYFPILKNEVALKELWLELGQSPNIDLFPKDRPVGDWLSYRHPLGYSIVKKVSGEDLKKFSPSAQPFVFKALNKLGGQGWLINKPVLDVLDYYIENQEVESPVNFSDTLDEQARTSKEFEASAIRNLARSNQDRIFYNLYNLDYRGRIYNNTSFLSEQSSDTAKGLLLLATGHALGPKGLFWLKVHIANCLGADDLPLKDRVSLVDDRHEELMGYAVDPTVNTGWFSAEKPWSLLAAVMELWLIQNSGVPVEEFVSHLPIFIDGTVSGTQHLVAMVRDKEVAPFVNLVPANKKGDLYAKVAEITWSELYNKIKDLPPSVIGKFENLLDKLTKLQQDYTSAPYGTEKRSLAWSALSEELNHTRELRDKLWPLFWSRVDNLKERRKLVKRNVMTVPYGLSRYGAGEQIVEDSPSVSEYIARADKLFCIRLGELIFRLCRENLGVSGKLLSIFEILADRASAEDKHLSWTVPVTNFPVKQNYRKPTKKRTRLLYAGRELHVILESWLDATINSSAQKAGASPNIVHSLDAAHMTMTIVSTNYPMAVIHDSFGCTPGNMEHLFHHVRATFIELYKTDPLKNILTQLDALDLLPDYGSLDLNDIANSDFAFS